MLNVYSSGDFFLSDILNRNRAIMKKIRYFRCDDCNDVTERLINDDVRVIACECGGEAKRMLSAPRSFGNTTGKSPSSSYSKPR